MAKNNARLYDPQILLSAGIDPNTGLPLKYHEDSCYKSFVKRELQLMDLQEAVNSFSWQNLPDGLTSELIERILYFKGQGALIYSEKLEKFMFLPYTLNGSIDEYGRYDGISVLPFNGTMSSENVGLVFSEKYKPIYDIIDTDEFIDMSDDVLKIMLTTSCVLLHDHVPGISQKVTAHTINNDWLIDLMADVVPFMRTSLINSTGVTGVQVGDESESANVKIASETYLKAARNGQKYVPITGPSMRFQELTSSHLTRCEEFLMVLQSLDNLRLSMLGLDNGGIFQKKAHKLESEQRVNSTNVGLVMRDKLRCRQEFCNIANSIWGFGMWVEPSEVVLDMDVDGSLILGDDTLDQNDESYISDDKGGDSDVE